MSLLYLYTMYILTLIVCTFTLCCYMIRLDTFWSYEIICGVFVVYIHNKIILKVKKK